MVIPLSLVAMGIPFSLVAMLLYSVFNLITNFSALEADWIRLLMLHKEHTTLIPLPVITAEQTISCHVAYKCYNNKQYRTESYLRLATVTCKDIYRMSKFH